jgi:response regulator RpfG family c-di-GMP phosphodiesterase
VRNILLVDDDISVVRALKRICLDPSVLPVIENIQVFEYVSAVSAVEHARERPVDIVISDFRMPDMDGAVFLSAVKAAQPEAVGINLCPPTDTMELLDAIDRTEIPLLIDRPWNDTDLKATIAEVLKYHGLLCENRRLADEIMAQRASLASGPH